jgi:hypothetical protein
MSKQTAVEWMIDKMINKQNGTFDGFPVLSLDEIFEQAKEMEKEQIMEAYNEGNKYNGWALKHESEKYYNETYKNK